MKLNEFDQQSWKYDVEAFERWKAFYCESTASQYTKRTALKHLCRLQARWPAHKLGEMPNETETA